MEEMKDLKQGSRRGNQFREEGHSKYSGGALQPGQLPLHERLYLQRDITHTRLFFFYLFPSRHPCFSLYLKLPRFPAAAFRDRKPMSRRTPGIIKKPRVESSDSQAALLPVPQDLEELVVQKIDLLSGKEGLEKHAASLNGHQQRMSPQAMVAARRPDHGGTVGSTVSLVANHFLVQFDPKQKIFHYDVDISPRPSKETARQIKRKLVLENSDVLDGALPAFDGRRNLYSSVEFQHDKIESFASLPLPASRWPNKKEGVDLFGSQKSKLFELPSDLHPNSAERI
ncbi:hypothetical protein HPP92_012946 [Vanilla planifolia]|uniref:Protein argonaute N-terminal domain-containing protein n=1 Tax=Vanilla planifolia TaxID=51239 RepID=A0A835R2L4_VANPL|nr:hypothetical protein HPP92_012946 [Vanilla planifolia]